MAIRFFNPGWIILGAVLAALCAAAALALRRRERRRAKIRAANTERFRALPAYRRKRLESIAVRAVLTAALAAGLICSLLLAARPYEREPVKEEITRKDVFLCVDISSSGCAGLDGFVEGLRDQVPALDGDQIGIYLFNTSGMQYVPVTEDYAFVAQKMDDLAAYFRAAEEFRRDYADRYDRVQQIPPGKRARYEELNAVLSAFDRGTTAGYEIKGTSAIGEGLASCLFSFPELHTEERPRIILFVTDNLPEYIGDPLVTLEEVADMCAYDRVTVYGVYPAVPEGEETSSAKAQMKAAVESTGGAFFELGNAAEAEQIFPEILNRARTASKTVTAVRDTDVPEVWTAILLAALVLCAAAAVYPLARAGRRAFAAVPLRRKLASAAVLLLAAACAAMIAVRPLRLDADAEIRTTNLDVCFAVDTTISMWAKDYDGEQPRMAGVKEDIAEIMEALPGSSFSLIRFDNGAQTLAPYISNTAALEDCVGQIGIPAYSTAEGSSLNTAHDAVGAMLRASEQKSGTRKSILFLMSDGEITDGSELIRFSDLESGVDDGAVLGYGTAAGGRMNYPGKGYLQDTGTGAEARSAIDESNLKTVAGDLGINYVSRQQKGSYALSQLLARIRRLSRDTALQDGDRTGWQETYYYWAGMLALILMGCLYRLLRRGSLL